MNCLNVHLQGSWSREWFSTIFKRTCTIFGLHEVWEYVYSFFSIYLLQKIYLKFLHFPKWAHETVAVSWLHTFLPIHSFFFMNHGLCEMRLGSQKILTYTKILHSFCLPTSNRSMSQEQIHFTKDKYYILILYLL